MIDKKFVYTFHQLLKNHLPNIKLSHSREVLASFYGFKSMASLVDTGFILSSYDFYDEEDNFYDEDDEFYNEEDNSFDDHFNPQNKLTNEIVLRQRLRKLSKFVQENKKLEDNILLDIRNGEFLNQFKFYSWNAIQPWMVNRLGKQLIEKLISGGNASAMYSYAVFHLRNIKQNDTAHNDYWYKKYISGAVLEGGALVFAKEYEEKISNESKYQSLLKTAAQLGNEEAMMKYSQLTDDPNTIRNLAQKGNFSAIKFAYEVYGDIQYEEFLAFRGHHNAILSLMEKYEHSSKESEQYQLVFLNELANLYGYYPTNSIADNDEDHGPVFVLYLGISLPKISEKLKLKAKSEAQKVFNQHN